MSASIESIVRVSITKGTRQVTVQGFGTPCIFGPSDRFMDPIRYYTDPADMLTDGFLTSDPEYIEGVEIMSQQPSPEQFGVSHYTAAVAQVNTVSITSVMNTTVYTVTINGVVCSYTSDADATGSEIQAGLIAAINASAQAPNVTATAGAGTSVTVTSDVAGLGFTIAVGANLTVASTTANHSIAQDIATLQNIDDTWYGVIVTSYLSSDILQVAAYIETQDKFYVTSSSDSNILTSSTTDIMSVLKSKNYTRTSLFYATDPNDARDGAWLGRMLPTIPGSSNWKFKTLVGITADSLSQTQINFAQGKNANIYVTIGGVEITTEGVVASGEYNDVTILIDWIKANMQSAVYSVLVNVDKVPFTNKGIAAIENPMRQILQEAQDNGGLAAGWTVTAPDISNVPSADKASRTLNGMEFDATLAGAINKVRIQGFLGV